MQDLKLCLIQSSLKWEDKSANLTQFAEKISGINSLVDVIVLPEMFNTGFTMNAACNAEKEPGLTLIWMQEMAVKYQSAMVGSIIVEEDKKYYNRLYWVFPDGKFLTYDKRHLFRMAGEDQCYASGSQKLIVEYKGWRICPLVCYDLRFPVWSRNTFDAVNSKLDYDCLIYIANWPKPRRVPWQTLLKARAMENLSYVVGVNRVGVDASGHQYSGDSLVAHPNGEVLVSATDGLEECLQISLSYDALVKFRKDFPAYLDADTFVL